MDESFDDLSGFPRGSEKNLDEVVAVLFLHIFVFPLLEWIQGSFAKNNPRPPIASAIGIIKIGAPTYIRHLKLVVMANDREE